MRAINIVPVRHATIARVTICPGCAAPPNQDASRAIEISTFLDEDAARRPPPPTLLKAYVRRATARTELGQYTEAESDLRIAGEMAPEKERVEVLKQVWRACHIAGL